MKLLRSRNRLNGVLNAINIKEITDSLELLEKQLKVKVIVIDGKGKYEGKKNNMIVNYYTSCQQDGIVIAPGDIQDNIDNHVTDNETPDVDCPF